MAHTASTRKRVRQSQRRRQINRYHISRMRTAFKKFNATLKEEGAEAAEKLLPLCQKLAMRAAAKGAIHKNEASRRIARAARKLKQAQASA